MSGSVDFCDLHRPLYKNPQLYTQRDNFRWIVIADLQPVDFENFFLFNDGTFTGLQAYKNSKAANIMFVSELAKRLGDSGVKVNAVCPGKESSLQIIVYHLLVSASSPDTLLLISLQYVCTVHLWLNPSLLLQYCTQLKCTVEDVAI